MYIFNTITGIRIGHKIKKDWKNEPVKFDFYDIKIDVLKALEAIGLTQNSIKIFKDAPNYYHPGSPRVRIAFAFALPALSARRRRIGTSRGDMSVLAAVEALTLRHRDIGRTLAF